MWARRLGLSCADPVYLAATDRDVLRDLTLWAYQDAEATARTDAQAGAAAAAAALSPEEIERITASTRAALDKAKIGPRGPGTAGAPRALRRKGKATKKGGE